MATAEIVPPRTPAFAAAALLAMQGRTLAAWLRAGGIVVEGAGELARRQAEIARDAVDGFLAGAAGAPEDGFSPIRPAAQVERFKAAYVKAVADAGELAGIAAAAQARAGEVLIARVLAAFDELRALVSGDGAFPAGPREVAAAEASVPA